MPSDEGWCPFFVVGKGKSEGHRRTEASRDRGHLELHLDCANVGREAEDRASPILVGKLSKDRWLTTHPVPCKGTQHRWIVGKLVSDVIMIGVQTLVVMSDQEVSIVDVKNSLMRELRGVEGLTVLPEESLVGASAANAVIESERRGRWLRSLSRCTILFLNQAVLFWLCCGVLRSGGQQGVLNVGSRKAAGKR